jgi:hypothetical protein
MSTTDIIPGMTEVMDYIKKQEEKIKTLEDIHSGDMKIVKMLKEKWNEEQEKNKKLREEIEELKTSIQTTTSYWTDKNELLQEEIEEKEETFKYQSDMEKQCHNDDIDKKQQVIDELEEEKDGYFQAWLYYWSGGSQGKEHTPLMSEIEDGKYQKILEEEEEEERKAEERNNMKEFLERHNITENDMEQLVKESADYDLPK